MSVKLLFKIGSSLVPVTNRAVFDGGLSFFTSFVSLDSRRSAHPRRWMMGGVRWLGVKTDSSSPCPTATAPRVDAFECSLRPQSCSLPPSLLPTWNQDCVGGNGDVDSVRCMIWLWGVG